MSPEDKRALEDILSTTATTGWDKIMEDVEGMKAAYNRVDNLKDANDMWRNKGRIDILNFILNYQKSTRSLLDEEDI